MNIVGLARIQADAELFAQQLEAQSGKQIGFDLSSLGQLDALLSEWIDVASIYDSMSPDTAEALAGPVTCYVGEVLVRSIGAQWIDRQSENDSPSILRFASGQKLDLRQAVVTVLRGLAPPAFHELALALQRSQHNVDDDPRE